MVLFIKYPYYCWFLPFITCTLCARIKFITINNIRCISIFTTTNGYINNQSYITLLNKHYPTHCKFIYSYFVHFVHVIIILLPFNIIGISHKMDNGNWEHFCGNSYWRWRKNLKSGKYIFLWRVCTSNQTLGCGHLAPSKS
eukprot:515958_1